MRQALWVKKCWALGVLRRLHRIRELRTVSDNAVVTLYGEVFQT